MPFYEYECSACKFYVEALQKITDPPMVKCPSCGKPALQRLISAPVFRLKGSGWYETDFKSDKENKRNLAGGEDKPAETKDGEEGKAKVKPVRLKSTKPKQSKKKGQAAARKTSVRTVKKPAPKKAAKPRSTVAGKKAAKKKAAKKK